jgi:hypothetical protein
MNSFLQAIENLSRRKVTPSWFRWREWSAIAPAIRNRSFFSATVTSARVLNKMRNMLLDWQADATEEIVDVNTGQTVTAYKETGLAKFRERSAEFLIQEGLATPADYKDTKITNVISNARLQLIYNTNLEQASTFAQWQGRMRNEDWLNLNPAARFVRRPGARIKRQRHVEAEGDVRRWDDFAYWQFQNAADIGGFDVPWGPFGFNSYMIQEPVKRAEAERRKLVRKGERVKAPNVAQFGVDLGKQFNAGVDANIDDLTPELANEARQAITDRLGPQAIGRDGKPTLDALRQALSGNYKPIASPQAPATKPLPVPRKRATKKPEPETGETVPEGSKVADKIVFGRIIGKEKEVRKKWDKVAETIDSIHGDGPLPPAPVIHQESRGSVNGQYRRFDNEITTFKEEAIPMTLTHEIGHWIDYRGFRNIPGAEPPMKGDKVFASYSPLFKNFIKIAKNSSKIKEIKTDYLTAKSKRYLTSNHEIFARAYAQYIATKSKNPEMLENLKNRQTGAKGNIYPDQWDDDDFVPLYNEIETIFKQIGWLKISK